MKRLWVCPEGHLSDGGTFCPSCGNVDDTKEVWVHDAACQIWGQFGPPQTRLPDGTPAEPGEVFVEHLPRVCTCRLAGQSAATSTAHPDDAVRAFG